ncbi:hypothetical protein, variant [Aphanomyces invadans]|uniref:Pseudouridine synthase RsuA/RluA-like domain-containing protein n=1 Tax=Aphanomyces invadans TaxID=157072 RepID=A0A024U9R0_9STRA|nr:hypothetical protein, variant [Aphanomyces invadans]ETW03009.1 hypothetical protein, variant [Aphanomyces invadans]|eukprot:XP_008868393.1 hypothetical protein, variant [Aphanomyces invadans]
MRLFPIIKDDVRMRLDRWLKVNFQRPQSFFQRHLRQKRIFLFDASTQRRVKVEASFVLPDDANLRIGMTPALFHELTDGGVWNKLPSDTSKHDLPPELALPILFEDEFFVALHKPVHLATQLGTGMTDSVASRYLHYKLVHRLDKETSGVLLLAKTRLAAADMATLFRDNKVQKTYVALVHGTPALGRSGIEAHSSTTRSRLLDDYMVGAPSSHRAEAPATPSLCPCSESTDCRRPSI